MLNIKISRTLRAADYVAGAPLMAREPFSSRALLAIMLVLGLASLYALPLSSYLGDAPAETRLDRQSEDYLATDESMAEETMIIADSATNSSAENYDDLDLPSAMFYTQGASLSGQLQFATEAEDAGTQDPSSSLVASADALVPSSGLSSGEADTPERASSAEAQVAQASLPEPTPAAEE
ncbi:MAG: hypothetical protein K6A65_09555, partial [Succinivibrionaceae bacterium]|nr:hypothetical protein [Succinivibrionaceae bacterium]